ncbi:MAG: carbon-nitrogen hydrolase family protein [bacterium]
MEKSGVWKVAFVLAQSCLYFGACVPRDVVMTGKDRNPHETLRVALVQFDARPEQTQHNLTQMERLVREAVRNEARLVMFHEGTLSDYTPRLDELAETVPEGPSVQRIAALAKELDCYISFGLSERDGERFYISQVFVGPEGFIYSYRKTWLWRDAPDEGYRNEWARYDPGTGPEIFSLDGIRATCFICVDGEAPRCVERAKALKPELIFYPNNRGGVFDFPLFGKRAATIGAPMLVANRIGKSWCHDCLGGCVAFGADGTILEKANCEGEEEILYRDLSIPLKRQK